MCTVLCYLVLFFLRRIRVRVKVRVRFRVRVGVKVKVKLGLGFWFDIFCFSLTCLLLARVSIVEDKTRKIPFPVGFIAPRLGLALSFASCS